MNDQNKTPLPFIKWVGGKRKLAKTLSSYIPQGLNNYYEPFLGGGALFFNIRKNFKRCFLSDINLELVTAYNAVKYNPEQVKDMLQLHEEQHSKEYFYQVRDNNNSNDPNYISARFLYLNRHTFKGIYQINNQNKAVIYCLSRTYKSRICDRLQTSSKLLRNTTICANDFSFIQAKNNDFVYFDPPYHQSGEKFYTRLAFGEADQIRLRDFAKKLTDKGVKVMLSNNNTPFIRDLYCDFNIMEVEGNYALRNHRQIAKELIITNYKKEGI